MGNASARAQPSTIYLDSVSQYRNYLLEYSNKSGEIVYTSLLGDGKFLKSIAGKLQSHNVIVKIYRLDESSENLSAPKASILRITSKLRHKKNVLPYVDIQYSPKSNVAFLLRQYIDSSLEERLSSRPFLHTIEKRWLAFQCLKALETIHSTGICHGDIKVENVLVSTWNWVLLSDFASFKPTYLPEDDPAEYYYYFRPSTSRSCTVAPERFYSSKDVESTSSLLTSLQDSMISAESIMISDTNSTSKKKKGPLKESMDIFSMGCVLAEIFNGKPLFDLPSLLRYRSSSENNIADENLVSELVTHMVQLDPKLRLSAEEYREKCTGKLFPTYFNSFLFTFMQSILSDAGRVPDSRILFVAKYYEKILTELCDGSKDPLGVSFFNQRLSEGYASSAASSSTTSTTTTTNTSTDDDLKERAGMFSNENCQGDFSTTTTTASKSVSVNEFYSDKVPALVSSSSDNNNGIVIILRLLCVTIRHVGVPETRITGIHLLTRLSIFADDDARLQLLIPFIIECFDDTSASVRATSIKSLTKVCSLIQSFPLMDASVFPQYILPALGKFPNDEEQVVRITFAECLPAIAESSRRFLEVAQVIQNKESSSSSSSDSSVNFDSELHRLHQIISRLVIQITAPDGTNSDVISHVKRALLSDITRLCIFFGRDRTLDVLLPQLITVLNASDFELRAAFFDSLGGVCAFIGRVAISLYVLPCIEQALVDTEELVIRSALSCLTSIVELGFMSQGSVITKTLRDVAPLLLHPSRWIRESVCALLSAIATNVFDSVEVYTFMYPILRPFVTREVGNNIVSELKYILRRPVTREAFDKALVSSSATSDSSIELSFIDLATGRNTTEGRETEMIIASSSNSDEEQEKLKMMENYIKLASRHMKSTLHLSKHLPSSKSLKLPLLHSIRVPDMRFALLHPSSSSSTTGTFGVKHQLSINRDIMMTEGENVSVKSLIHRHGLVVLTAPNGPFAYSLPSNNSEATVDAKTTYKHTSATEVSVLSKVSMAVLYGSNSAIQKLDVKTSDVSSCLDASKLQSRITSLNIPSLHPSSLLSPLVQNTDEYSTYALPDGKYVGSNWKPSESILVATLSEHSGAVNKIAVPLDHQFITTASNDGTVKLWSVSRLDRNPNPESVYTTSPNGRVTDVIVMDNSHTIVSANSTGCISAFNAEDTTTTNTRIVAPGENNNNLIVSLRSFTTNLSSVLVYASANGEIIGHDLRTSVICWKVRVTPELGRVTALVTSLDGTWVAAGTSAGVIAVYDIRFSILVNLWRHSSRSSVTRLERCPTFKSNTAPDGLTILSRPLVYVATGRGNDVAAFDLNTGACRGVFRTLGSHSSTLDATSCTGLEPLAMNNNSRHNSSSTSVLSYRNALKDLIDYETNAVSSAGQVRAMLCPSNVLRGVPDSLITAGDDRHIRYWDLKFPKKSFTVCGINVGEPKTFYDSQLANDDWYKYLGCEDDSKSKCLEIRDSVKRPLIYLCQDSTNTTTTTSERRGPVPASPHHNDSILDLGIINVNNHPMLVSSSRDGLVKIWA